MAQIANFGRSIDRRRRRHAQAGFPSLRLLSPAGSGSGRGRVGYFTSVRAETTERASTLSDPDEGSDEEHLGASLEEPGKLARNFLRLSNQLRVPQDVRSSDREQPNFSDRRRRIEAQAPPAGPGREGGQRDCDWKQSSG